MERTISSMMGMTMVIGIVTEIVIFDFSEYQLLTAQGVGRERLC